jgi:hypothetical protein
MNHGITTSEIQQGMMFFHVVESKDPTDDDLMIAAIVEFMQLAINMSYCSCQPGCS